MKLHLYSDGGSRGNPGLAAYGFLIFDDGHQLLKKGSRYLGVASNNEAEYRGLLAVLKEAISLGATDVVIRMDSELVVRQVIGQYDVKAENLRPLRKEVVDLLSKFSSYDIKHVRREDLNIVQADRLVNEKLDICTKLKK